MGKHFGRKPKCLLPILGLSLIERLLHIFQENGINEVIIVTGYQSELIQQKIASKQIPGINIIYIKNEDWEKGNESSLEAALTEIDRDEYFLLVMSDHLYDPHLIKEAVEKVQQKQLIIFYDDSVARNELEGALKITVDTAGKIFDIGKQLDSNLVDCGIMILKGDIKELCENSKDMKELSELVKFYSIKHSITACKVGSSYWQDIDTYENVHSARNKILRSLITQKEGFISRNFNRHISLKLTSYIASFNIKPNSISFISFLISVLSGALFFYKNPLWAGIAAQLSSIIDGVDGEIARVKFLSSRYGGYFDSILDRYGDVSIITGMAFYSLSAERYEAVLIIAVMAMVGSFMSMISKEKFHSEYGAPYLQRMYDGWTQYLPSSRDGRLFIIFLGGVFNQVFPALVILALLTNFQALYRLMYTVKKIKV
ncbi:MAG: hypothetical protein A2Y62_15570 [Candidatus Fischerbacteria bacterium RBG_13_37_8]|uniref:Bifunctional IPC transferase and DIPP synthase n=1 Tax=Candidatus Fischerbacteria bacterium RBG_13_37_8 TaxID=1817863 RepID=A0A1F5VL25_9BACT|nr:MAG: hypothetical protein A2Y62_15570 [Candidatus Fischerbacteria bacterium RBG_13_37_8]